MLDISKYQQGVMECSMRSSVSPRKKAEKAVEDSNSEFIEMLKNGVEKEF